MLKLVEDSDGFGQPFADIRDSLRLLGESPNLNEACIVAQSYFELLGHDLVSVIFCSQNDTVASIRPFRNLPQSLVDLAPKLQQIGGCPPKKEAQRLLQPFDWKRISKSRYKNFISQRFLTEARKLPYANVLAVPVAVGGGIAVFTVGIDEARSGPGSREEIITAVGQIATAMICRFPELSTLFEPKTLSTLQASVLLFAIQGVSNRDVATSLGLGELAVGLVLKSAQEKLGAANLPQAVARALAYGEFSHMQIGEHDLI